MADGTQLDAATTVGDIIATDDISDGGVANAQKVQRIKVGHGINGKYVDAGHYQRLPVTMGSGAEDAFGRLRVSSPLTIFESKQIFDNQPLIWENSTVSGSLTSVTHSANRASTKITSTLNTACRFVRQTYMRFNYQSGKSQQIMITSVLGETGGGTGVVRSAGYYDDDNGVFFKDDEGVLTAVVRSNVTGSPVDTEIVQSSFNLDKLDGTGDSGFNIDITKAQIMVFDFEWLGVGIVRVGFVCDDGHIVYAHAFQHANAAGSVYMSTPNLPVRYEMVTQNPSAVSTLECICSTVISEGGTDALGAIRYTSTGGTHVNCNTENIIYAIVGVKLKAAYIGASIDILNLSLNESQGNNEYEWLWMLNPTVAGTFTYSNETNSALMSATGATANTVTGGTQLNGDFAASANRGGSSGGAIDNAIRLGSTIAGVVDEMVLCVRPIGGTTNLDIEGGITWRERQ